MSLPALEFCKTNYTEVWVPSPVVPLIQFADEVRAIASTGLDWVGVGDLPVPQRLKEKLQSFQSIISWYGANRAPFRKALADLGVPCEFHRALPSDDGNEHAADFFARQVGAPIGFVPQISVEPSGPRNSIAIHPFSGGRRKNWPLASFRKLAEQLPFPVEWTVGPEECLPESPDPVRFANLLDLAKWLKGARLYIGNDSGITHLAAAAGAKVLALFGETNPAVWAPRGNHVTVLQATPFTELSVESVYETATRLLSSGQSVSGPL